jgi:cell division protein ZapA|tara:strand:- start:231 stop:545 length:315 start_codon:yes stop_codon:yes gene_type:complete
VANTTNTLTVSILEREFRVNCPADSQDELTCAAKLLDDKMREIRNASNTSGKVLGTDRIAVIAALNIAHQLQQLQRQQALVSEEIGRIDERLEEALMADVQLEL